MTYLVGGHEDLGQLVVVLEVDSPDGESLRVEPCTVKIDSSPDNINWTHFS